MNHRIDPYRVTAGAAAQLPEMQLSETPAGSFPLSGLNFRPQDADKSGYLPQNRNGISDMLS